MGEERPRAICPGSAGLGFSLEMTGLTYLVALVNIVKLKLGLSFVTFSFSCQVFDATNTTRERRHMILHFAKENDFKVSQPSYLIPANSGQMKASWT